MNSAVSLELVQGWEELGGQRVSPGLVPARLWEAVDRRHRLLPVEGGGPLKARPPEVATLLAERTKNLLPSACSPGPG